jgi:hypothetical protein
MAATGEDATALLHILMLFPRPDLTTNRAASEAVDEAFDAIGARQWRAGRIVSDGEQVVYNYNYNMNAIIIGKCAMN